MKPVLSFLLSKKIVIAEFVILILLTGLFFGLSKAGVDKDVINPDGINWHKRSTTFFQSLQKKHYKETYQSYHPGITLMWISGPVLDYLSDSYKKSNEVPYSKDNFLVFDYYAKMSVIVAATLTFLISLLLLRSIVSFKYAAIFGFLYAIEPFIIGNRRLYHLDFLMTQFLFLSFLFFIKYFYHSNKIPDLIFASLFYILAILTKSSVIISFPVFLLMMFLGNSSALKKIFSFVLFLLMSILFIYVFFPALWSKPIKAVRTYYKEIYTGVSDIGVTGKKELGYSGAQKNVTLDDTLSEEPWHFYLDSLMFRLSPASQTLLIISLGFSIYYFFKQLVLKIIQMIKEKKFYTVYTFKTQSWLSIWSLALTVVFLTVLSICTKKIERYEIVVFPFLLILITFFIYYIHHIASLFIVVVALITLIPQYKEIYPYFYAYSNPLLGGVKMRMYAVDDTPFGIGTYAAFDVVKNDRKGNTDFFTISGSKSVKAISEGARFSRSPSCVTDYIVYYYSEEKPFYCSQDYSHIGSVKVGNMDYWNIYKRTNQKHESNYN